MGEPHKIHLFNCDRVYKLDSIEQLLMETKAKLGFEFSVEKHYFSLSRINELSDQTIPKLQMDFAVLAVHANESRLSINEDMEYGYTKVYRALLQSTGGNVIIVIGGDDNYKNEDEENRVVISHWARRKVGFQFKEEFLDGTKSFIFSWNKKHREIHEEALLHYFDPSKKGQKFEHQPHQRNLPSNPAIAAPKGVTTDHERALWENKAEQPLSRKNVAQEEREDASLSSSRPTSLARGKAEEGAQPVKKVSFLSNEGRQLEGGSVKRLYKTIFSPMSSTTLRITLLASEWNSSKGGLSTMNRELAIHLAKHPNVSVTLFVPKCTEDDKKEASSRNITIVEARERPGFEPIDWLSFPSRDLVIDIIIGHGVKLGKQAQVIIDSHHCKWIQVVHTAPDELAMFKTYTGAISKGDEKQWTEVKLCQIADLVVAVGPKLCEVYSRYLSSSGKTVFNLTPGIFTELSHLKPSTRGSKKFWVLVFGRGDSEDFELKGFDIAAKAVAKLNDKSYNLIFVGAPSGNETQVAKKLLKQGLRRSQLTVKGYLENRDDLATLLSTANLAIIPSRTEGFGLTALEALSAGLPFLVSQNSGFGEALDEIPCGSSWIVDSEDPEQWAEAIKAVREKGKETALKECQELRTHYAEKYSWEEQCNDLVEKMVNLVRDKLQMPQPDNASKPGGKRVESTSGQPSTMRSPLQKDQSVTEQRTADRYPLQRAQTVTDQRTADSLFSPFNSADQRAADSLFSRPFKSVEQRREDSSFSNIRTARANTPPFDREQGARPKEVLPSSTGRTELKDLALLGCNVSKDCMHAAMKVLRDIAPKLNLSESPPVENLPPDEAKRYLTRNKLKCCVLMVDAGTFKDAYENLPQRKVEYEDLLETAADKVDKKVIILICDTCSLPPKDEAIVNETIERIINKTGKGFTAWLKHGRLTVDPDVLVQVMNSKSTVSRRNPQTSPSEDFQKLTKQPQGATQLSRLPVMLKSTLRNGVISYQPGDVQIQCPGFKVPGYIIRSLLRKYVNTPEAGVTIIKNDQNGKLLWSVDPKTKKDFERRRKTGYCSFAKLANSSVHYSEFAT